MPVFGDRVTSALLPGDEEVLRRHRKAQRDREASPRPRTTLKDSERRQVYIYSVGPFDRRIDNLGSVGIVNLKGLERGKVLKGLNVGPATIIPGLPAEQYAGEPRGVWLEHENTISDEAVWVDADGERVMLSEYPGIDLALRIIGAYGGSAYIASPFEQGYFVSMVPEQTVEPKEPKEPGDKASATQRREYSKLLAEYEEASRIYVKWQCSVEAAKERFSQWAMRRGEEQTLAWNNGTYQRDEELFVLRDIFGKTEKDWPFLSGTTSNVKKKNCWSCGRPVDVGVPKCMCGELQISQAEYDKRRAEVLAGTAA